MDNTPTPPPIEHADAPLDEHWQDPPRWPKAVGTISIVWGALSLTCAGCGVAGFFMSNWSAGMAPPDWGPPPPVMMPGIEQLALQALGALWAVLLIVAGILVVNRNPAGRIAHLVYAVGSVLLTAVAVALAIRQQNAIADWARNNPDSMWAQQNNPTVTYIALAVGILLGLAWPAFCFVWFGLIKRRPEDLHGGEPPVA